jgi:hypothetical protein
MESLIMMKKVFRSFTIYFLIASLLIIYNHYKGQDSHGIVLFELNPILSNLRYTDFANNYIKTGPQVASGSLQGDISIFWYFSHFISFALYGLILDSIRAVIMKYSKQKKNLKS